MPTIINKLFPFTSMKIALINACLSLCPDSTKESIIRKVIAKQLPDFHMKHLPYTVIKTKTIVSE